MPNEQWPLSECLYFIADVFGSSWLILCAPSGEKFKAVLLRMSQLASSGATELRVRSLDAISQLLTLQVRLCTQEEYSLPYIFKCHLQKNNYEFLKV